MYSFASGAKKERKGPKDFYFILSCPHPQIKLMYIFGLGVK